MNNIYIIVVLMFVFVFFSTCEAKGGRGGGGGRSSSRSSVSSRGSTRSGRSSSSYVGSNSNGGGGWFHGFFHSTPHYIYRPVYVARDGNLHYTPKEEYSSSSDDSYAVGYAISRALSNDFFSIFNVVHGISKYPDKIKNNELTTTESPVLTYSLKDIITNDYSRLSTFS